MKTFTLTQFKALVNNGKWAHVNSVDCADYHDIPNDYLDDEAGSVRKYFGFGQVVSTYADLSITWTEGMSFSEGVEKSFAADTHGMDKPLEMNFQVVEDEDQDETVYPGTLIEILTQDFTHIDYSAYNEYR